MCRALGNPSIQIIEFFMSMPPTDVFTQSEITEGTGLHRHTVRKCLKNLLFFEFVEAYKKVGNTALYKLARSETVECYVKLMEKINHRHNYRVCEKCFKEFKIDDRPYECSFGHIACYECSGAGEWYEGVADGVCPIC
jgi:Fe2+ or Zn2+ uptake regulation protein